LGKGPLTSPITTAYLATWRALLCACLFVAFGLPCVIAESARAEPALPGGFQDEVAFDGLELPTTFRFSPDGRVFVAEKSGIIKVFDDLEDSTPEVFADLRTQVYSNGDRGLLGLALDPDFPAAPYVYALYVYDHILGEETEAPRWGSPETTGDPCPEPKGADACLVSGRLVRLTADGNHAVEDEGEPLLHVLVEDWCQQFSSHTVDDLEFGPEGALYASAGEGANFTGPDYGQFGTPPNPCGDPPGGFGTALEPPSAAGGSLRSQNVENLSGSIIRIDPVSGEGLPDNPMATSLDPDARRIVAFGLRNPFRFAFDPQTGELYTGNVGWGDDDEIDRFATPPAQAYNSGWPCYEGPGRQYLFKDLGLAICDDLYAEEPAGVSRPFFYYSHEQTLAPGDECPFENGSALSGLVFYEGGGFPAPFDDALFFADSVRGCIYTMTRGKDGRPDPLTTNVFMRGKGDTYPGVDLQVGPDGALYYASFFGGGTGAINRISYEPGAPTARLSADPRWGEGLPLEVNLDASKSTDPDGEELEYEWDLNNDGMFASGGSTRTGMFGNDHNEVIAVRVVDGEGLSSVARITVYPGDSPPVVDIEEPDDGAAWGVGEEIKLNGSALDSDGTDLDGLSLYWSTRLAHCPSGPGGCHTHPLGVFAGLRKGSFLAPEHDFPSYIEVTLNAVDARGLSASETVRIDPRTVELEVRSDPAGVPLTAGLVAGLSPLSLTAIEGSNVVLAAPQTAQLNGRTYAWEGWSDGGARVHTVLADESADYTALYSSPELSVASPLSLLAKTTKLKPKLKSHPPRQTRSRTARFTFSGAAGGAGYRCKLDRGRFAPCRSPRVYRGLKPGRHVFRVIVGDEARSTAVAFRWRVLGPVG
jgi:glucose/arabinose dehydrogenase